MRRSTKKNIVKFLKTLFQTKNQDGWSQLPENEIENIEWNEAFEILKAAEGNDIIINRKIDQYKLKNGLAEQVLYEMTD